MEEGSKERRWGPSQARPHPAVVCVSKGVSKGVSEGVSEGVCLACVGLSVWLMRPWKRRERKRECVCVWTGKGLW